jgi:hypothetical protein
LNSIKSPSHPQGSETIIRALQSSQKLWRAFSIWIDR